MIFTRAICTILLLINLADALVTPSSPRRNSTEIENLKDLKDVVAVHSTGTVQKKKKVSNGFATKTLGCKACESTLCKNCFSLKCPGDCDFTPGADDDDFLWFCQVVDNILPANGKAE